MHKYQIYPNRNMQNVCDKISLMVVAAKAPQKRNEVIVRNNDHNFLPGAKTAVDRSLSVSVPRSVAPGKCQLL